ncbi:Hsp20/alpha crystallin family protein [Mycobacterium sp. DL440]|uniref:Hsp20/alpha crystallin family protein n=1 Tax=Mycobacterium sp. DL440 TaxID=2675523 RepID=UPI00141F0DEF|nr:Hsp20/alpha crystallin family protein [Mycobacterium sp. DL440]
MELADYDPWRVIGGTTDFAKQATRTREEQQPAWTPALDAFHTKTDMVLRYEVPGVLPDDLEVRVDGRVLYVLGVRRPPADQAPPELTMRAERIFGDFDRSIALPAGTDPNGVRASYFHGVLEIRVRHVRRPEPRDVPFEGTESSARVIEVLDT